MNLLDLFVKISCKDEASPKLGGIASNITGTMTAAAGIISAVMGSAAVAGAVAIGKSALDAYASYEQLVGGIETLFKESSDTVQQYAANAYKTAGVSANSYMEQATAFSASLIQSLGGDTKKAAEYANTAIMDMSDNANKMGTSIESIQDTYQSLMRGNYAMLDNLKLGYGGTKAELERLVEDAEKLTGQALDPSKFSDVITAIHAVQTELGITGTTSREAATTIEGSVNTMKAAWSNWLAGLGNEDADMSALTDQLVESVITAGKNIVPRVGIIATEMASTFASKFPSAVYDILVAVLPSELSTAFQSAVTLWNAEDTIGDKISLVMGYIGAKIEEMVPGLGASISVIGSALGSAFDTFGQAVNDLVIPALQLLQPVFDALFESIQAAQPWLTALANVFAVVLASAISVAIQVFASLVQGVTGAINIVTAIWNTISGFVSSVVQFFTADVPNAINNMMTWFGQLPGNIANFLSNALASVIAWVSSMAAQAVAAGSSFLSSVQSGFANVVNFFTSLPGRIIDAIGDLGSLLFESGKSLLQGFIDGIENMVGTVTSTIGGVVEDVRSFFPFSPAKRGPFSGRGYTTYSGKALITDFAKSIVDNGSAAVDAMQSVMDDVSTEAGDYDISAYGYSDAKTDKIDRLIWAVESLHAELGKIISESAPVATPREFSRMVRAV